MVDVVHDKLIEISQNNANRLAEVLTILGVVQNELQHKPDETVVFRIVEHAIDRHNKYAHSKKSMNPPMPYRGVELSPGQRRLASHIGTALGGALLAGLAAWFNASR